MARGVRGLRLPCPTLLCPAGGPPPKWPYGCFWGGPPSGRPAYGHLLPPCFTGLKATWRSGSRSSRIVDTKIAYQPLEVNSLLRIVLGPLTEESLHKMLVKWFFSRRVLRLRPVAFWTCDAGRVSHEESLHFRIVPLDHGVVHGVVEAVELLDFHEHLERPRSGRPCQNITLLINSNQKY
jgi:hypothetical protein